MSPKFAQSVDPIFLYVLALLERIGREAKLTAQEERLRIRALIDQAEAALGSGGEWEMAKYAIVSWIDEMLVGSPWVGRDWWSNNVMEIELYNTRQCNEQFFVKSREAANRTGRDALEVYYVCVILGFRGLYHDTATSEDIAKAHGLPEKLIDWTRATAMSIRLGQGRPALAEPKREVLGAPPLRSRSIVVWPWLTALLLGAAVIVVLYFWDGEW
jgi:type VI secretion system protein ImpK